MKRIGIIGAVGVIAAAALIWIYYSGGEPGAPTPGPATTASTDAAPTKKPVPPRAAAAPAREQAAISPTPAAPAAPAADDATREQTPPRVAAADPPPQAAPKPNPQKPAGPGRAEPNPVAPESPSPRSAAQTPKPPAPKSSQPKSAMQTPTKPRSPSVAALPPEPKSAAPATPVAPSFDVVRVEPNGDAVIAGRAPPGWEVIVRDGDEIVGRVTANSRGEWVLLPDKRFQPGSRELRLSARGADGSVLESDRIVALAIPERKVRSGEGAAPPPAPPLAVELPKSGEGRAKILQGPKPRSESAAVLAIDIIEYDGEGNIVVAGRATPGGTVRVYLNDQYLGESVADGGGAWRIEPDYRLRPGSFTLWAIELDGAGQAIAKVEASFEHGGPVADWPAGREIIIVHGHTLWWIARRLYGRGERYAVIFAANRDSIRDPDLIYPGQKFSLPQVD